MATYLETVLEDGDLSHISAVLGDIARVKGMAEIAVKTGLLGQCLDSADRLYCAIM